MTKKNLSFFGDKLPFVHYVNNAKNIKIKINKLISKKKVEQYFRSIYY